MILFLDFDGVLHPEYEGQQVPADVAFCHLPRFESVMRDFPTVKIVISSMWRHIYDLKKLKKIFSPDISERIIGTTTIISRDPDLLPHLREREIVIWLEIENLISEPWLALDDAFWQFQHHRNRLVTCASCKGFDAEAELRLRAALSQILMKG